MVYRDPTPLDPNKDYTAEELAKFILEKMYGKHTVSNGPIIIEIMRLLNGQEKLHNS